MGASVHVQHVPDVKHVEERLLQVNSELARLDIRARDLLRAIQDTDAEIESLGEAEAGPAIAQKHRLAHELRVICRQLTRAQLHLIPADDPRKMTAGDALLWLHEAEERDRPWSTPAEAA